MTGFLTVPEVQHRRAESTAFQATTGIEPAQHQIGVLKTPTDDFFLESIQAGDVIPP